MTATAWALFVVANDAIRTVKTRGFNPETEQYLFKHPIPTDGDFHIARFYQGGPARVRLTNSLPGSTFQVASYKMELRAGLTVIEGSFA